MVTMVTPIQQTVDQVKEEVKYLKQDSAGVASDEVGIKVSEKMKTVFCKWAGSVVTHKGSVRNQLSRQKYSTATLKAGYSAPAVTDQLALFALPPTETGVEKHYRVNYRPVSQLVDDYSPIKFSFSGAIDMIDLRKTELHVRAKIVDKDGGDVAECVALINLILHSLFETHAIGGYPYAAYWKTIKCLGADMLIIAIIIWRYIIGFKLDGATWMPLVSCQRRTPNDESEKRAFNSGALHRRRWFTEGKTFEMQGRLLTDVCDLSMYLLNSTEAAFKLYRNRHEFVLGALDGSKGYKNILEEIYLQVSYVKPSPGVLMGVGCALEKNHKALYPFTMSEVCTFNITAKYQDIYLDYIFQDIVPSLIMVGLVDCRAKIPSTSSLTMSDRLVLV